MKPVMMAGEDTVPREGSYRQFFDNKRMVAFVTSSSPISIHRLNLESVI
jgi:hypothetical protein